MADTFPGRVSRFLRAARQLPNNAAAARDRIERLSDAPTAGDTAEPTDDRLRERLDAFEQERLDELARELGALHDEQVLPDDAARGHLGRRAAGTSLGTIAGAEPGPGARCFDLEGWQDTRSITLRAGAEASSGTTDSGDVIVRSPRPLDWRRATYVLVRAAPTRHVLLLHPGSTPLASGVAELHRQALTTGATMVCGTVVGRDTAGAAFHADPSAVSVVDAVALEAWFNDRYLSRAVLAPLDAALAATGASVRRIPRLTGSLSPPEPTDVDSTRPYPPMHLEHSTPG